MSAAKRWSATVVVVNAVLHGAACATLRWRPHSSEIKPSVRIGACALAATGITASVYVACCVLHTACCTLHVACCILNLRSGCEERLGNGDVAELDGVMQRRVAVEVLRLHALPTHTHTRTQAGAHAHAHRSSRARTPLGTRGAKRTCTFTSSLHWPRRYCVTSSCPQKAALCSAVRPEPASFACMSADGATRLTRSSEPCIENSRNCTQPQQRRAACCLLCVVPRASTAYSANHSSNSKETNANGSAHAATPRRHCRAELRVGTLHAACCVLARCTLHVGMLHVAPAATPRLSG